MTRDYYSVLRRATSALAPSTAEARHAVYDRARLAIMDAGLPPAQTSDERAALEAAIGRIEAEAAQAQHTPLRRDLGERVTTASVATSATDGRTPARPALSRRMFLAVSAAALLLVVVAGAAYWPRGGGGERRPPPKATGAPVASAERTTTGSSDVSYIFKRQLVYYRTVH